MLSQEGITDLRAAVGEGQNGEAGRGGSGHPAA